MILCITWQVTWHLKLQDVQHFRHAMFNEIFQQRAWYPPLRAAATNSPPGRRSPRPAAKCSVARSKRHRRPALRSDRFEARPRRFVWKKKKGMRQMRHQVDDVGELFKVLTLFQVLTWLALRCRSLFWYYIVLVDLFKIRWSSCSTCILNVELRLWLTHEVRTVGSWMSNIGWYPQAETEAARYMQAER